MASSTELTQLTELTELTQRQPARVNTENIPLPFSKPFRRRSSIDGNGNDTKSLEPIAEEQQSLDSSNGTPLQRQQNITYHNDEEKWVNICLRCPTKGTCITCGSQNHEPPRELLRSKSVCICDAKDHYKGHEH